jgi:hypothetical protein
MKSLLIVLILLAPSCFASTAQIDGNELVKRCKPFFDDVSGAGIAALSNIDRLNMGYCAGYIAAVLDMGSLWKAVEGNSSHALHECVPESVPNEQVLKVLKKWTDNHPEKLHERADSIIIWALADAFPCK